MTKPKRKVTLSLDGDVLEELQSLDTSASLSSLVESAVTDRLAMKRQREALDRLRGEYEAEHGPLSEAKVLAAMERMEAQG